MMAKITSITVLAALTLSACASTPRPETQPAFTDTLPTQKDGTESVSPEDISPEHCPGVTTDRVVDLTPEGPVGQYQERQAVDPRFQCMAGAGNELNGYAVFALPSEPAPVSVLAGGLFEGPRVLSARIEVRDAAFQPLRTIDPSAFRVRDMGVAALFRMRPNDAYVVITPDRSRLEDAVDHLVDDPAYPVEAESMAASTFYADRGASFVRVYFEAPE